MEIILALVLMAAFFGLVCLIAPPVIDFFTKIEPGKNVAQTSAPVRTNIDIKI